MTYNTEKHHRRSIRLKEYDYTRPGAYFATICTEKRVRLFGNIFNETMQLNRYGNIIQTCWNKLPHNFLSVKLDTFVVMPNHLHGIVIITERDYNDGDGGRGEAFTSPDELPPHSDMVNALPLQSTTQPPHGTKSGSLGAIMQNFKSVSTRKINTMNNTTGDSLWQRNYYDHIIRNERALNIIRRYILYNPLVWAYDMDNPDRHPLSTEKMKCGMKQTCGFTDEELDFIIDYDIKYRMKREMDGKT
ncbi:MAG: hypothetical protein HCAMLNBO_00090 [Candidatus Brocadia fulgida]|nr:hypothetical protein [Candidatus Brocadia fulgida]